MPHSFFRLFAKRLISSAATLFLLVTFIFLLITFSPGGPEQKYMSPGLSRSQVAEVKKSFRIDEPVWKQYIIFAGNIFTGNLGISYTRHRPVIEVIKESFPFTFLFALTSFIIQILGAYYLSLFAYKKKYVEKIFSALSLFFFAIPTFILGIFLIYIFAYVIKIFPSSGLTSIDADEYSSVQLFWDYLYHLALPVITLSTAGTAVFYKYLKDNLSRAASEDFVVNLRSYGMKEHEILRKHIIPNAVSPLITIAGIELGLLLGGALITEVIFGLPGMGRLTMEAIMSRDYPVVIGASLTAGVMMIIANIIADLIKIKLDKRLILTAD